jgi:peroxiredoxin
MPLKLKPGDRFPDLSVPDHTGEVHSIAQVADGQPLILAFFRGPW